MPANSLNLPDFKAQQVGEADHDYHAYAEVSNPPGVCTQMCIRDSINRGYQDVTIPSDLFDAVLGNPPFGNQRVYDARHPGDVYKRQASDTLSAGSHSLQICAAGKSVSSWTATYAVSVLK